VSSERPNNIFNGFAKLLIPPWSMAASQSDRLVDGCSCSRSEGATTSDG